MGLHTAVTATGITDSNITAADNSTSDTRKHKSTHYSSCNIILREKDEPK